MSMFHRDAPTGDIHQIHQWAYADATAKAAATGFATSDVGKVALQIDTATYYILTATTPTWQILGDASASGLASHIANTSNPHAVTQTQVGLGNVDNTSDATKNSATATLSNKTFSDPITLTEVTTPATPSSTHHKLYPKVDGNLYHLGSDGVEKALGGGGGGGSLQWVEDTASAIAAVEYHNRVYLFTAGAGQALYALIKVPASYVAGSPINLKSDFYSPDSSGTALIQSVATLIRQGADAMSSTTNQRTSTNAAVTLGAGTVNIPQGVTLDLSDSTGKINAVAVSAGDLILVSLQRGSDTATSDLRALVYGTEVTFQ